MVVHWSSSWNFPSFYSWNWDFLTISTLSVLILILLSNIPQWSLTPSSGVSLFECINSWIEIYPYYLPPPLESAASHSSITVSPGTYNIFIYQNKSHLLGIKIILVLKENRCILAETSISRKKERYIGLCNGSLNKELAKDSIPRDFRSISEYLSLSFFHSLSLSLPHFSVSTSL